MDRTRLYGFQDARAVLPEHASLILLSTPMPYSLSHPAFIYVSRVPAYVHHTLFGVDKGTVGETWQLACGYVLLHA